MYIKTSGKMATGNLAYNYYQKDKSAGSLQGQMKGDYLFAKYKFMSEGNGIYQGCWFS